MTVVGRVSRGSWSMTVVGGVISGSWSMVESVRRCNVGSVQIGCTADDCHGVFV